MSEVIVHPVSQQWAESAHINAQRYEQMYRQSIEEPDVFWAEQAREFLTWSREWDNVCDADLREGRASWFGGGKLNVAVNCIDRHLPERAEQTAFIWESDEPDQHKLISYRDLHEQVSRLGNVLRQRGVQKGDRVCIYMPMIPEAAYAMLACARIGAVHSVVFGGFSQGRVSVRSDSRSVSASERQRWGLR